MTKKIGELIRAAREKQKLTRPQAAKALGISEGYFGHLERSAPVHLSEDLQRKLVEKLKVAGPALLAAATAHAVRSRKWYKAHAAKPSKRAKKAKVIAIRSKDRKRRAKATARKVAQLRKAAA